jgi:L-fuconolactonase
MIDAHLHVWDLSVSAYAWLGSRDGVLHQTYGPERAAAALAEAGVAQAVLVQAEDSLADTAYLLDVAARQPFVAAVVGWVPLDDPAAAIAGLDRWQQAPAFRGVRHLVHDDPRDDFLAMPSVRRSLAEVARRGLAFDVPDAWPRHLAAVADLARALPELTVVVDHLAKPPRGTDEMASWAGALAAVAPAPNTVAKLSGLQAPGQPFTTAALRPVFDLALELFGPRRLMYGGDWPLTVPFGGYRAAWSVYAELISTLPPDDQEWLWWRTASHTYRLPEVS